MILISLTTRNLSYKYIIIHRSLKLELYINNMEMRKIMALVIVTIFLATVLFFAKGITAEKILTVREVKARIGVILDDESRAGKEAKVGIEMALDEFNNNGNPSFVLQLQVRNSQSKPWLAALAVLFFAKEVTAEKISPLRKVKGRIGVILDDESRVGKEAKVGIEMALDDLNNNGNQSSVFQLQVRYSQNKPWLAAFAAKDLIDKHQVNVILGLHSWGEVSSVAEIASEAQVPIFSLANSAPQQATNQWPFLIQAAPANQTTQMQAVAAIIKSRALNTEKITLIYENTDPFSSEITQYLNDALQEDIGEKLTHTIVLSPFSSFSHHLERLKRDGECKVFVLHSSLSVGVNLLEKAKKMGMMKNDYVWIVTNTIMDLLHSFNSSTVALMQGVLGIKSYFPQCDDQRFQNFKKQFRRRFFNEYPDEENYDPGVFAVQAYDATTGIVLALNEYSTGFTAQQLVDKITKVQFNGLTGEIQFLGGKQATTQSVFEVIQVNGNSNIAFWTYKKGFSDSIPNEAPTYSPNLRNIEKGVLPRRHLSTNSEPLKVLVPLGSLFKEFVEVLNDSQTGVPSYDGFSIKVFKTIMYRLKINYTFVPFNGSYNELVYQIHSKHCDAVAGDVAILENRTLYADFTQPYAESGLEMIVPIQSKVPNTPFLFLKPFTEAMWGSILGITIYNGFIIWLIERNHNDKLREGTKLFHVGTLIWLSFTTLFTVQGGKLHNNFSRMAMVVWLFVALIITQSYTASLSSMLTKISIEPTFDDIKTLKRNNVNVGYCNGTFVESYLVDVLEFNRDKVKIYSEPDYHVEAFKRGEIGALFLEAPYAKLFLARHCKSFVRARETFKVGGFGFAFRKDHSVLLGSVNKELLNITERGLLQELEKDYLNPRCVDTGLDSDQRLSLESFWLLFVATFGTSSVALVVYTIKHRSKSQESKIQFRTSSRVSHAKSPKDTPNASNHWTNEEMKEMANAYKDDCIQESPEGTVSDLTMVHVDDELKSSTNVPILGKENEESKEQPRVVLG